jgi:threonylcarbamoyladenosine tRNA methylthiotransferase MtaB
MNNNNQVITFGCRLNSYESAVIKEALSKANASDAIVFNTCSVTKEAERQARQAIRKYRRLNPTAKIYVTGCAAQINPQNFAQMPEVDVILGNQEKLLATSYLENGEDRIRVNDIMSVKETASHMVSSFDGKSRAFVQVQNGCNHRCTFCIIPYGRGNSRSTPPGEIVEHIKKLVDSNYKEIVLTGVDITDYGIDLPGKPTLGQVVKRILKLVPELARIRLSSIDVAEIDNDLLDLIANEPRFMPYLHISLQAGDDMILKRMKRRHSRKQVIDFCSMARNLNPNISFGADIIAGFPTETDEMFTNSLNLVSEAGIQFTHVFPYSEREGTPAARMPQVPAETRKLRAKLLRDAGQKELTKFSNAQIGKISSAIIENDGTGRLENFLKINFLEKPNTEQLVKTKITKFIDGELYGEIL